MTGRIIEPETMRPEELVILRQMVLDDVPLDVDHARQLLGHIGALEEELSNLRSAQVADVSTLPQDLLSVDAHSGSASIT